MQYSILKDERLHKYISFPDLSKEEELECIKKWISDADTNNHEKWVIELKENNTQNETPQIKNELSPDFIRQIEREILGIE